MLTTILWLLLFIKEEVIVIGGDLNFDNFGIILWGIWISVLASEKDLESDVFFGAHFLADHSKNSRIGYAYLQRPLSLEYKLESSLYKHIETFIFLTEAGILLLD